MERIINQSDIADIMALTPVQEGMLFHYLKEPELSVYHEQLRIDIRGELQADLLERAWQFVIQSNEMLRAVIRWKNIKQPVQIVLKQSDFKLEVFDFTASGDNGSQGQSARDHARQQAVIDLENRPFRVSLYRIAADSCQMFITNHHILYDGWSNGIILKELFTAYDRLAKEEALIPAAKTKFKEFIKLLQRQDKARQSHYWQAYLDHYDSHAGISIKQRHAAKDGRMNACSVKLEDDLAERIKQFSRLNQTTSAALFYSAWGIVLQKYNRADDVLFGTVVSGRETEELSFDETAGLFIHTLPLRMSSLRRQTLVETVTGVARNLQERAAHDHTPLTDILKYSGLGSMEQLFDSIVVVENYPLDHMLVRKIGNIQIAGYELTEATHYDVTVNVEAFDEVNIKLTYYEALFDRQAMETMCRHYIRVIENIVSDPQMTLDKLKLLSAEEERLLERFNDTEADYPRDKQLHQLFEEQVRLSGSSVAVYGDGKKLTYSELNAQANRLARMLRELGVGAETVVGICADRSIEMMVGILAVLKAGGAYLPIDPKFPQNRIRYVLEDSQAAIVLTHRQYRSFDYGHCRIVDLDDSGSYTLNGTNLDPAGDSRSLAYIIYTSGSTGNPKGVMVEHHSVVNRLNWMQRQFPLAASDVILQKTPIVFDVSVWELFWWGISGASVCLLPPHEEGNPETIMRTIESYGVTTIHFVPSMLNAFMEYLEHSPHQARVKPLQRVFASGEALHPHQAELFGRVLQRPSLINLYGPTEATVDVTCYVCPQSDVPTAIPIGKPIHNIGLYVLDRDGQLAPEGVPGELGITGVGLARGYRNKPDETARQFIRPAFLNGRRLYKTGDLARWLPDGNMEYLGRIDHQVKIRGYRIELGEIEQALNSCPSVKEAAVVTRIDAKQDTYLTAYYAASRTIGAEELKAYLLERLPAYMCPAVFVELDSLPLTTSGKVNRRELPEPVQSDARKPASAEPDIELEKQIAEVWKEFLAVDRVGREDNFFEIGGNSLKLIRVQSKLQKVLGQEVSISVLLRYSTVAALAQALSGDRHENSSGPEQAAKPERKEVDATNRQDIAVIGMAGRFPGAETVDQFWSNLAGGVESITFFSKEQLIEEGIDPELVNKANYVRAKGVLDELDYFDNDFFGYSSKEAEWMDPQLRMLHEVAWEALETAGYSGDSGNANIGMYAGASSNYYWIQQIEKETRNGMDAFSAMLLNEKDFFSTRVSYKLNLKGPSLTAQTACSTSLTTVDLACQGLLSRKCDIALAGGVGITYPPKAGYLYEEGMIFSPDGHCRAFDAEAKGTLGGNGIGLVVLKRLEDAVRDGDHIYAVIKSSVTNNDGSRKLGFTAPSIEGQAEVIRKAHKLADIPTESISYVETHGSGTILGDVVELEALKLAFRTEKSQFCAIGSVKTNVGHLDGAAGITGLIKTVLSLKHRQLPPSLHYSQPNPKFNFSDSPFYVNAKLSEWKKDGEKLRAGVSSFGMGGSNAHLVLEEYRSDQEDAGQSPCQLIVYSARTMSALEAMTDKLYEHFTANPAINLSDAAYSLKLGRRTFPYRRMLVCSSVESAASALKSISTKKGSTGHVQNERRPLIFMFSGIGSQYVNMGRELYETATVFKEAIDRTAAAFKEITGEDYRTYLYPSSPSGEAARAMTRSSVHQPIVFMFEYALAALLGHWGIRPTAMIGYSFGEITAACVSGVLSVADACRLIAARSELIDRMEEGSMVSIPLPKQEVELLIGNAADIGIAIDNGPSCVVAGTPAAVDKLEETMRQRRLMGVRLDNSRAIHSRMMLPITEELAERIGALSLQPPGIPYISNVTGNWIRAEEAANPSYWAKHLTSTVQFADGIRLLLEEEDAIFLEIGPNRDLSTLIRHHMDPARPNVALNTTRNPHEQLSDLEYLYQRVGQLWLHGVNVDWKSFYANERRRRIPLPTYPFERKQFWPAGFQQKDGGKTEAKPDYRKKSDMAEWMYMPSWERSEFRNERSNYKPRKLLVFDDPSGMGEELLKRLAELSVEPVTVQAGERFIRHSSSAYAIDPNNPGDYDELFKELKADRLLPEHILFLWPLQPAGAHCSPEHVQAVLNNGYYSLLNLMKAIGQHMNDALRISVLTANMYEVTGLDRHDPAVSTVLGPGMTIPVEYPNVTCQYVDLDWEEYRNSADREAYIGQVVNELTLEEPDQQLVAIRGRYRWLPAYVPSSAKPDFSRIRVKRNGTYLITGGLGGIGLTIGDYLCSSYQANLVLVGRSPFPAKEEWPQWLAEHEDEDRISIVIRKALEWESGGSRIYIGSADVSSLDAMQAALGRATSHCGLINGVIHAAGAPDGGMIQLRDRAMSETIFAAKVTGTLVLDRIFKEQPLDFMVLFSSLSTIVRSFGQVAYTSANLFLDAFANSKSRNSGYHVVSINWDTWLEVGMAVHSAKDFAQRLSIEESSSLLRDGILPREGIRVLMDILSLPHSQVIVSTHDLKQTILKHNRLEEALPEALAGHRDRKKASASRSESSLDYMPPTSQREEKVVQVVKEHFHLDHVGVNDNIFDLGATSFDMIQINVKLKDALDLDIPIVHMFQFPTISLLVEHLQQGQKPSAEEEKDRTAELAKGARSMQERLKLRKRGGRLE